MAVEQAKAKATKEAQRNNEQMLWGAVEKYKHLKEMAVEEGRYFLKMKQLMRLVARLGRQEGVCWRTCYNKLSRKGQLKGNQLRKPRLGIMNLRDLPFPLW